MQIHSATKIARLIKEDPRALEAIISLSPKFEKLRNPLLRKVVAARTTIAMACAIGGCTQEAFFDRMRSLSFTVDETQEAPAQQVEGAIPAFMQELPTKKIIELDVRPVIAGGKDPFQEIMTAVAKVREGGVLKILNTFAPTPLVPVLSKKGFEAHIVRIHDDYYESFFHRQIVHKGAAPTAVAPLNHRDSLTQPEGQPRGPDIISHTNLENLPNEGSTGDKPGKAATPKDKKAKTSKENKGADVPHEDEGDWDTLNARFAYQMAIIDVRELEMPMPMHRILETLDTMHDNQALYVYHKRIPVFLIPELKERGYDLRIQTLSEQEVHLLIFKA